MQKNKTSYHSLLLLVFTCLTSVYLNGQNNVGINTATPHPSALLDISDTSRGVLITQTDTASIQDYVDNLTPPSPIADGLMIYEINEKTYMYYDGKNNKWRRLIDLVGPTGNRGDRGPTGPVGPTGYNTDWRDSNNTTPTLIPNRDKCGDYYFNNATGQIWVVKCDSGYVNPMWVDSITADNYIGVLKSPDEVVYAETLESFLNQNESPSGGGATISEDISFVQIAGLNYSFLVYRDEVAYVYAFAHGTTSFSFGSNDYGYAQYDIQMNSGGAKLVEGQGGKFYFDRDASSSGNMGNIVALSKNGPPPPTQVFGKFDQVGWSATGNWTVQGPLTPAPPCYQRCGISPCPACPPEDFIVSIAVQGGARVSNSNVDIKIADDASFAANKRNKAFLTVFVIRRRSPDAVRYRR